MKQKCTAFRECKYLVIELQAGLITIRLLADLQRDLKHIVSSQILNYIGHCGLENIIKELNCDTKLDDDMRFMAVSFIYLNTETKRIFIDGKKYDEILSELDQAAYELIG